VVKRAVVPSSALTGIKRVASDPKNIAAAKTLAPPYRAASQPLGI